jgi:hypothetical protein
LLKEIGVISLRGARSGIDEKVVELAKLFQLCGCDFLALKKYFEELQLSSSHMSPVSRKLLQRSQTTESYLSSSHDDRQMPPPSPSLAE